jgi:hypothetical protein
MNWLLVELHDDVTLLLTVSWMLKLCESEGGYREW